MREFNVDEIEGFSSVQRDKNAYYPFYIVVITADYCERLRYVLKNDYSYPTAKTKIEFNEKEDADSAFNKLCSMVKGRQ